MLELMQSFGEELLLEMKRPVNHFYTMILATKNSLLHMTLLVHEIIL